MEDIKYSIRYATQYDFNYIFSTWRKSMKQKCKRFRGFTPWAIYNDWFTNYSRTLANTSKVLIACSSEDLNQILGFVIYRPQNPPIIHYLYTKSIYQGLGIASALLKRAGIKDKKILCSNITDEIKSSDYNVVYLPNAEDYYV